MTNLDLSRNRISDWASVAAIAGFPAVYVGSVHGRVASVQPALCLAQRGGLMVAALFLGAHRICGHRLCFGVFWGVVWGAVRCSFHVSCFRTELRINNNDLFQGKQLHNRQILISRLPEVVRLNKTEIKKQELTSTSF